MLVWIKLVWRDVDLLVERQGRPFSLGKRERYGSLANFCIGFNGENKVLARACADINMRAGLKCKNADVAKDKM